MSMDALFLSANKLLDLGIAVGSTEVVGRNGNRLGTQSFSPSTGALAGIIHYSLSACLEPTWSAIRLHLRFNQLGETALWVLQIGSNAALTTVLMQKVFYRNVPLQQGTLITAVVSVVNLIVRFLVDAGSKSLT